MSLETSRKILKVFGIIGIIFGIIGLILSLLVLLGGGMVGAGLGEANLDVETTVGVAALAIVAGILLFIGSVITLLEGIFSLRASKDTSKIMPAFVFALLGLVFGAINFVSSIAQNGGSGLVSNIISLLISCLVFIAANTIRKSNA